MIKEKVFISYSRNDLERVLEILHFIERELGTRCWMDLTGVESGSPFDEVIMSAIDKADILLFMMSDNSLASTWAKREVTYAENRGKRIVPLSIDGKPLRGWMLFRYGTIDCIDASSSEQMGKLTSNLNSWLADPAPTIPLNNRPPFSNHTIKDKKELYGRDGLLKKLLNSVDQFHYNVNVVGCRRFGKTCLLEVLYQTITESSDAQSYPLYIDAKSWNIGFGSNGKIGTARVYKYLLATLLEALTRDNLFDCETKIRDVILAPVKDRHAFYNSLDIRFDSSIADLFADTVRHFSEKIGKTIAFLFDEYEFLMTKAFGESTGFQTIRKLSAEDNDGFRPCSFLVAGAVTWEHLCSTIGSKELNTIGSHIHYVKPLKREDFYRYWQAECDKIKDENLKGIMFGKCDFVYELSGGIVFHANDIGGIMLINDGEYPQDYSAAIEEVFDSLNFRQKETLINVSLRPDSVNKDGVLIYLRSLGLVSPDAIKIPIKLLNDSILENHPSRNPDAVSYIEVITNEINDLIETINDTVYNKGYVYMFTPQNSDATLIKSIKQRCIDKLGFGNFVDAIWKTHYEKTKDEVTQRTKAFLPEEFRRTQFTDIIATLRHTYSGHLYGPKFIMPEGRLSKEEALFALVGSKNEPYGENDFLMLQKAILDLYKTELIGILTEVRTWEKSNK